MTFTTEVPIGLIGAVGVVLFAVVFFAAAFFAAAIFAAAIFAAAFFAAAFFAAAFFAAAFFAAALLTPLFAVGAEVEDTAVVVVVTPVTAVVVGVVAVAQPGVEMVSVSSVTAPFSARTRPSTVTECVTVMLWAANTVPRKLEPVPSVAELPTCQNTLQAWAPLISTT